MTSLPVPAQERPSAAPDLPSAAPDQEPASAALPVPAKGSAAAKYERKPRIKDTDLKPREKLLVSYVVHGVDHWTLARRVKRRVPVLDPETGEVIDWNEKAVAVGQPLTLDEAARLCLIRPRHARWLSTQPAYERLLRREMQSFREGAKAHALHKVAELIDEPGEGKAADRTVQLKAAQIILGEDGRSGTNVNVTVNNQTNLVQAGVVVKLPPDLAQRSRLLEAEPV